uniref:DDE Tnp4 domain-containing protein n=1 Tax=Haemonchus contortus TaxID=6289 RepID=A0A7I4XSP3_HAECO
MYYCSLCRALQPIGTIRYRWSDKTSTAILISCFVKLDFLTLDDAKVIYDDIRSDLKYVCNDHYVEALLFLADEIEQRWETFPLELIDDVPVMIIRAVIRQIQGNISSFDVNVRLEAKHIRAFFKGCLTRYGPEVQRRRPSSLGATHVNVDDDNDALPYSLETPSPDCVEQTEGAEHSGIDVPGPSATVKEEDISQSIEECRSSLGDPMCEGDEDGARLDGPHCTLCGVCRTEGDMRVLSSDVPQSVIIIGSLCNSNMIDIETARRTYNEVQLRNGKFCKEHFIDAARYISREVQRLWGSYPGHGFQVPSSVRMDCVLFFEKIARSLGERVKLNENDLIRFYNDCMEKYHKKICWRHMQDPPESRENSPSSSRTSQFPTSETATMHHGESESCLLSSKGKRLNISPSENDTSVKKPKRQKDYYCAVCSCFRPAEDCREASLPDLLIVIACMAMDYKIDVHTKAKLGEEILYGWRFLCKQHYIEAATFIYCDVKQNGESLSERNFTCLSDLTKYSLCERIEKHWDLIDTRLVVRDDEISCFFNDCQTRYNIVQVAEERSTTESKEERMQASVASVVDEVVAQSSSLNTSRSTTEGFSIMSANESETPALWSNRGMDQVKNDTWLSSEVEFGCPDSSNLHRKLEVCQRVATNPKRAQRCGICDQMRSVDSLRRMTSTRNLRVILLSLLLKQNLIAVIVAKQAYKSGSGLYVCHEHFIQAGAFLVSKFEEKFGGFDMFGLRKLLDSFVSDMVHTINLFGELITDTAKPKATDVHIFLNDYDRRYRKNIDWKIREIPMGNTSVAAEPSSVNSAELLNAKEESSVPFNPDVSQDGYEEQLFSSKHETNDASPCLIANDQEDPNVMGRLPETHTSKSPSCTSMDFVGDECQSADSQFEAEMFKEISVTDLLQSDYIAGDVPEDHSKDISMLVNGNIKSEEQVNISDLDRDCDGEGRFDEYIEEPSYGSVDSVQDELRRRRTQSVGEKSYSSVFGNVPSTSASQSQMVPSKQTRMVEGNREEGVAPISSLLRVSSRELLSHFRIGDDIKGALSREQILKRYVACSSLLLRNKREPFVDRLITMGEKWLFCNSKDDLRPFECQPVLLRVWWSAAGILYHSFHRANEAKSEEIYISQIEYVHKELSKGIPDDEDLLVVLLHDNTKSFLTRNSLTQLYKHNFEVLSYPPHSPDLLPSTFYFFKHMNDFLSEKQLVDGNDVEFAVFNFIKSRPPEFYQTGIDELVLRWQKCVDSKGYPFPVESTPLSFE